MAGELHLNPGPKMHLAYDVPVGQDPQFNMIGTFKKAQDESAFLVSIPMVDGTPVREVVGVICWMREMPKGGPFRYVAGIQLRFADIQERQDMQEYVAYVKKRYKL